MDALALFLSLALPWCAGCALLRFAAWPAAMRRAADRPAAAPAEGQRALILGYGYFVGLLLLTIWMRILSAAGVGFGRSSIGIPFVAIAAAIVYLGRGSVSLARVRAVAIAIVRPPLPRWQRILWIVLLAWLALRLVTLAVEIASRPLYPWDAWTQWATKARVWYALGRIVPFASTDDWRLGTGGAYFDVSPSNPATIPLLQAWGAIALGRWDDTATNWAWLLMLLALALVVYGTLRDGGVRPLGALTGAYLVSSLPLLDTHVALAGYADLMLASAYTLAALALHRWAARRRLHDVMLALVFAVACPFIDVSGWIWIVTLAAGLAVALFPRRGLKVVAWSLAAVALAIIVFARGTPLVGGLTLHLDASWRSLADAFLLFDNWHLLWYVAIVLAIVGARRLVRQPLAPLAAIVGSALGCLAVAALFSTDVVRWFPDAVVINRATLHVAPVIVCVGVLLWHELSGARERRETVSAAAPTHA
jgi:hypothetical protein